MSEKFTHADLLAASKNNWPRDDKVGMANHRRYYAQLVSPYIMDVVENRIGIERLLASKDEHFNDIPLKLWDDLTSIFVSALGYQRKVKELGGVDALGDRVCVLKEAARQLVEKHQAK